MKDYIVTLNNHLKYELPAKDEYEAMRVVLDDLELDFNEGIRERFAISIITIEEIKK